MGGGRWVRKTIRIDDKNNNNNNNNNNNVKVQLVDILYIHQSHYINHIETKGQAGYNHLVIIDLSNYLVTTDVPVRYKVL